MDESLLLESEEASLDPTSSEIDQDSLAEGVVGDAPFAFVGEVGEQPPVGEELAPQPAKSQEPPVSETARATQTTNMAQMYNTWVELGETNSAAQAEMQALLDNRRKAEAMRADAQDMLEQAESAWDEAGHLGDVARKAIERGFTVNLPGFATRLRMVDEIEQARITQAQLRRSTNKEAWEEADRARHEATTDLLKAMTAIAAAASQAERELRETANLPGVAESLRNSAMEDLKCVRSIGDELAHLGREAFSLLAISDVSVEADGSDTPAPVPITGLSETQPVETATEAHPTEAVPDHRDTVAAASGTEPQDLQATPLAPDATGERREVQGIDGAGAGIEAAGAAQTTPAAAEPVDTTPTSAADELRRELEAAASGSGTGGSVIQRPVEHNNENSDTPGSGTDNAPAPTSAADELERELAALRPLLASNEPSANPAVAPTRSEAAPAEVTGMDIQARPAGTPADTLLRPGQLNANIGDQAEAINSAPSQEPSGPVPENYSGRVYLMFPSTLPQDELESVWDILEEVAGPGTISDHQLISRQDGIQFTMQLGNKGLAVEQLRRKMPGANLKALAEDRLRIDLPSRG